MGTETVRFEQVSPNLWARVVDDKEVPWQDLYRKVFDRYQARAQHLFFWQERVYALDATVWGEILIDGLALARVILRVRGDADEHGAPLGEPGHIYASVYIYTPEGRHFSSAEKRRAIQVARAAAQHLDGLNAVCNAPVFVALETRGGRWRSYEVGSLRALREGA